MPSTNEQLKTIVTTIAEQLPQVGSALSLTIDFFWPEDQYDPMEVWNQVKNQTEELVKDIINQERVRDLEKMLEGLRRVFKEYQETSFGIPQKGQWFTAILSSLDQAEPFFFDKDNPQTTLDYFISLGTLKLTVLREQILFYKEIYLVEDPDHEKHFKQLKDKISEYSRAAKEARENALKWRLNKIKIWEDVKTDWGVLGPSKTHIWTVQDDQDGWRKVCSYNTLTGGNLMAETDIRHEYQNRYTKINAQFASQLDALLGPSYIWIYLNPENTQQSSQKPVFINSGPFGGLRGSKFVDEPNDQPITSVTVHAGSRVDGIEIFYGGKSGGVHGASGGQCYQLTLEEGENIISAHGRAGDSMDALFFRTSKQREIGGGGQGGSSWEAKPPEGTDAVLVRIEGVEGSSSLEGITFQWRYWREE